MTQWVPPPWPELRCANERTKAILSATRPILGNTPPSSMPGTLVCTAPTVLRNSAGAVIFGSKVSTCVGPPPSQSQTTLVLRVCRPAALAAARARSRSDRARPPMPSTPALRKSRRVLPSQLVPFLEPQRCNIVNPFQLAARPYREGLAGWEQRPAVSGGPP